MNVSTYNAYIDNRLAAIDAMDNEVRTEFGSDYTFLFQYFYPRVLELKQTENRATTILERIGSAFGGSGAGGTTEVNNSTATNSIANSAVSTAANTSNTIAGTTIANGTTGTSVNTATTGTTVTTGTTDGATGGPTGNCSVEFSTFPVKSDGTLSYG